VRRGRGGPVVLRRRHRDQRGDTRLDNAELAQALQDAPERFDRGETPYPALVAANLNLSAGRIRVVAEPRRTQDIGALMTVFNTRFREFPGMRAFSSRGSNISSNDGGTRSVNIDIAGADLAQLYQTAVAAYRKTQDIFDRPLLQIRPGWNRLAELGFTAQGFGFAVAALSEGAFVDEFIIGDDKIDIYVYSAAGSAQEVDALRRLPLYAPGGVVLPLESVAELRDVVDTDVIRRVDGRRTVTLNAVPPRSVALETAVQRVEEQLPPALQSEELVPAGMSVEASGAVDQLGATRELLSGNFAIATLLSYLLLVAIFTHWGWPLMILASVPLGLAGGSFGLALLNALGLRLPLDIITILGFLILLGTVVNNPILVFDRARELLREPGATLVGAVREAVSSRPRPILMTTLTTVSGLAPLVMIPGAGAELYRGLGVVVLSGLLFSTVVTLTFLPAALVEVLEWRRRRSERAAARATVAVQ
jgi:multidrug efflux pump subunit AcrB